MNKKLAPETVSNGIKVKKLNRLPIFIVFILFLAVLAAFAYLISQSGKRSSTATDTPPPAFKLDQSAALGWLDGKPKSGVIGVAPSETPPKDALKDEPTKIAPPPVSPELSLEQKEIARIRKAKVKKFEQALSSPMSVGGSGMFSSSVVSHKGKSSPLASTGISGGNPLDQMLKSRDQMTSSLTKQDDPNQQQHKAEFFMQDQPATEYLQHTRRKQVSPYEVKTGTILPATMIGGLNSDLPGDMLAQISQNVYDTATGKYLLIPQGSKLVGTYDNYITYGQNRALVAWSRLIYPDGSTIELEGMPGVDQSGYAGFEDQVNHHYFKVFGSAILMSLVTGAYDYSQGNTSGGITSEVRSAGDTMASAVARELAQTSAMLLKKNLDIQPTIVIRPGYQFNVMVKKDIIFPSVW